MATTIEAIQQLYIAFFNRPAEPGGLAYWVDAVTNKGGTLTDVSNAFAKTTEYQAQFTGMQPDQIVAKIYDNLFNRLPDQSGLNFWSNNLASGKLTISNIVDTIANSAVNNPTVSPADTAAITSKVQAAVKFTDLLNSDVALRLAYANPQAGELAKAFIHGVTDASSLAAAVADLPTVTAQALLEAGQPIGGTNTLTLGQDLFNGTSANDTFNTFVVDATGAVKSVLQGFDAIDGGAGTDTLNLVVDTGINDKLVGTVKNVEYINITGSDKLETGATGGTAGTIGADFFAGSTKITVDGSATTVDKVSTQKVVFNAGVAAVANTVAYGATVTTGSIGLSNTSGAVTVDGAKLATLTVDGSTHSTSGAADVVTLDGTGTANITKLNLGLSTDSKVDLTAGAKLTTIDASASKGGVELVGVGTTVATLTTGAGADKVTLSTALDSTVTAASVSTGAGKDNITVATTGAGAVTVNAGAGDDTIVLTSTLTASYKIDGGEGTDTLQLTGGSLNEASYVLFDATISNVEGVKFTTGTTADAARLDQFTTLEFAANSSITNVQANQTLITKANIDATAAGYVNPASGATTYAGTLKVNAEGTGNAVLKADSAVLNIEAGAANVTSTVSGDLKTGLTVNLTNSVDDADAPTVDTIANAAITIGADDTALNLLTSITLTGNGSVVLNNANGNAATKLATIDASALGGTLTVGANEGKITNGLTFTGNVATVESIKLGSGHDVVNVASTYEKMDTITGFDAVKETADIKSTVDSLKFGTAAVLDGATASADIVKMTLASTDTSLALAFTHAAAFAADANLNKIVQFVFEGNTYLFQDAAGGTASTLDATDAAVKLVGTVDLTTAFGVHA